MNWIRVAVVVSVTSWSTTAFVGSVVAQSKPKASTLAKDLRYTFNKRHDPNGIGKFYMGREIAHVMGYGFNGAGARWLERVEREREERLALMVGTVAIRM